MTKITFKYNGHPLIRLHCRLYIIDAVINNETDYLVISEKSTYRA